MSSKTSNPILCQFSRTTRLHSTRCYSSIPAPPKRVLRPVAIKRIVPRPIANRTAVLTTRRMSESPLTYDDGPLVWVDCEMTGLDIEDDLLIEIAVIITDGRLTPMDKGISHVIRTEKAVLDRMGEWCTKQHGKSGLTQACIDAELSHSEVEKVVSDYVKKWIPERGAGILAGSSVHADMRFLLKGMPTFMSHLSYRIVDVSSVKELARRWFPAARQREMASRTGEPSHRALDDIQASIRELAYWRDNIFLPLEPPSTEPSKSDKPRPTAL